jgi:hypothetical protein
MLVKFEVAIRALEQRDNCALFGSCPELPRQLSFRFGTQPREDLRAQSLDCTCISPNPAVADCERFEFNNRMGNHNHLQKDTQFSIDMGTGGSSFDGSSDSCDGSAGGFYV